MTGPRVGSTDVLKFVGVAAFLLDHWGLFFATDELWWRVAGRVAAPIFFFLVGYARPHPVPWSWLGFGVVLTALDAYTSYDSEDGFEDVSLNILLNFALLRAVVLPLVARYVLKSPALLALFTAACLLLTGPSGIVTEYGTEGWLFALLGLARRAQIDGNATIEPSTLAIAVVAAAAYVARETFDYEFATSQVVVLVVLMTAATAAFLLFRRTTFASPPPQPLRAALQACGRYSLEIYAVTLFAMQFLAYAIADGS